MSAGMNDPMAVVQAFNDACNREDLDAVTDFFADDAVIRILPPPPPPDPGVYTGKQAIRGWFEPQFHGFHVDARNYHASGSTVTWDASVTHDIIRQMGIDTLDATAHATVQDGKITEFVVEQTPESARKLQTAMQQQSGAAQSNEPA